ncbi:MAG: exonuclease domain-containing protein [Flavobacteriaceae bacterium]
MYAVLDIETTGGKFDEEGITEIAIYRYDGNEVVDQFASLINPERPIQPFVAKLTGINSKMLQNAPRFFEVAKRIIEITSDCIIVAHNTEFDYRILRTEFKRLGYTYERKSLCTVKLSQALILDAESYKLGKLVRSLGIPISDRHRAQGDAHATLKLFEVLLSKDSNKEIFNALIEKNTPKKVPSKYLEIIDTLPAETGVYYIYGAAAKIIYIGKSKNIKQRVLKHLTSKERKAVAIQRQITEVKSEICGSELLALLKEQHEIKLHRPALNHARKQTIFPMGIRMEKTASYTRLLWEQTRKNISYLEVFKNKEAAKSQLFAWVKEYSLCLNHTSLDNRKAECAGFPLKHCLGACTGEEGFESYNARIDQLVADRRFPHSDFLLIDSGRTKGEKSFVWVADGQFRGIGYFELNFQMNSPEKIEKRLVEMQANGDAQALIRSFIRRKKFKKMIPLEFSSEKNA